MPVEELPERMLFADENPNAVRGAVVYERGHEIHRSRKARENAPTFTIEASIG